MGFLKNLFGPKDPVEEMRLYHSRQEWADVLIAAKRIERETLEPQLLEELAKLEDEAGNALATINIDEGLWAHKSGNLLRAREDFQLAIEQARSAEVRDKARKALADLDKGVAPAEEISSPVPEEAGHAACDSCSPTRTPDQSSGSDLDEEMRMELLLAAMEPKLAERYLAAGPEFRKAWLATQDGDEKQAMQQFNAIPQDQRNALFLFERGSLLARTGQGKNARQDLQAALALEPELFPAFDALIEVLFAGKRGDEIDRLLKQSIAEERFTAYCWSRLAELDAQRGKLEPALAAGLKAIEEGASDPSLFILCAQLLERQERFGETEALLKRLPAGGCGGGVHPMLAEFWLRRGQNLNKALESFKGALRQERDNPRWLLRVAQVYMAKGWRKEAAAQVELLMRLGSLPEPFKNEVKALADQLHKS